MAPTSQPVSHLACERAQAQITPALLYGHPSPWQPHTRNHAFAPAQRPRETLTPYGGKSNLPTPGSIATLTQAHPPFPDPYGTHAHTFPDRLCGCPPVREPPPPPPPTRLEQTPPRGVGEDTAGPFPGPPPAVPLGEVGVPVLGEALLPPLAGRVAGRGDVRFHRAGVARRRRHLLPRPEEIWGGGRGEGMSCCPGRAPTPHPRPPSPPGPRDGRRHPPPTPPRRGEVAPGSPPAAAGRHGCSGAAAGSPRATGLLPSRPRLVPPRSPSGDSLLVVPVLPLPPSPVSEVRASCQAPGRRGKAAGPAVPPPSPAPGCPGYSPGRAGS